MTDYTRLAEAPQWCIQYPTCSACCIDLETEGDGWTCPGCGTQWDMDASDGDRGELYAQCLPLEGEEAWRSVARMARARAEKAEVERDAAVETMARVEAEVNRLKCPPGKAGYPTPALHKKACFACSLTEAIRAALAQPATDEATAKQGFAVRADEPRCGRSECRNGCGYPGACSEKPATDEGAVRHVGGNAEDCPACEGINPPYPFLCPATDEGADQ